METCGLNMKHSINHSQAACQFHPRHQIIPGGQEMMWTGAGVNLKFHRGAMHSERASKFYALNRYVSYHMIMK